MKEEKAKGLMEMVEDALAPLGVTVTGAELGSEYPFDGKELSFTFQGVVKREKKYRPYTDDEMNDIVGKVIVVDNLTTAVINHTILINKTKDGITNRAVVVSCAKRWWLTSDELLKRAVFRDTKEKCGVLVSSL